MKNFTLGALVLIGSVVTLSPGCGDDGEVVGSGGAAASGGKAGSSSGGTSNGGSDAGGSPAAGGDTGDAGSGTNEGGMPGGGGASGGAPGGAGAGFMNPDGCPEAAPASNDDCYVDLEPQTSCEYAGSRCICNGYMGGGGAGGAAPGNWVCQGDGADCPETQPATDDECNDNGLNCPYPGSIGCFCQAGSWTCDEPGGGQGGAGGAGGGGSAAPTCPEQEPANEDPCEGPIYACFYDETNTLCNCDGVGPDADEWVCQTF